MMKKSLGVILIWGLVGVPGVAWTQVDVKTMQEVVVTATRTPSTLDKVGGNSVTVISAEDIQAKGPLTVEEVLQGIPGIDVSTTGGLGSSTSVFMRGADSKNTLVLVDGVMFNDPSSANRSANLGNLTVDNIERIEIVRGAMSVLYGSNATAGVINIITKKGTGKPSLYGRIEAGSYSTWKLSGGSSGTANIFNYSLSVSRTETDGFSHADADNSQIPHNGNTSEDDGWENTTLSAKVGVDITPNFDINGTIRYLDSKTDIDDFYYEGGFAVDQLDANFLPDPNGSKQQRVENENLGYKVDAHGRFLNGLIESTLYYQGSTNYRDGFDGNGNTSYDFDGMTNEIGIQGTLNVKDMNLVHMGAGFWQEEMQSTSSNIDRDADITSFWIQDQLLLWDGLDLIAGVRFDDHDRFGNATTFRIAPAYSIERTQTTLKASYGTGFRAPSLFELYSAFGNPNLKEEKSRGWDTGFEQYILNRKIKFGLTYFSMVYTDRIDYDFATSSYAQLPGDTKTNGVEGFIRFSPIADLDLLLNYTYTDTEDPNGNSLVRRPENKIYFNARYRFLEKGIANLDIYWVDERRAVSSAKTASGATIQTLATYWLVNVSAQYDVCKWLQIFARADNVFNEFYEEAWSYATPGLSTYGGIKITY